jgi:hypothetical protein
MTARYPTLDAYLWTERKFTHAVVWCDHCRRWHWHSPEPGHRVAHCHCYGDLDGCRRPVHYEDGYALRIVGPATGAIADAIDHDRPIPKQEASR